jgi:hypothetical protein
LALADQRLRYLGRHWYDLLVIVLPLLRPLRLLRLIPLLSVLNRRAQTGLRGRVAIYVAALPTGSVTAGNRQPSESDVVHDQVGPGQHQIVAIACSGVRIGTRHVKHLGTTEGGESVGGSSCGG